MSVWHAGDLHMADACNVRLDTPRQIALDDLAVVEVHLHFQVVQAGRGAHLGAHRMRLGLMIEEVARDVARVDGLDHQRHAGRARLLDRPGQVVAIGRCSPGTIRARGQQSGQHMQGRALQRDSVVECLQQAVAKQRFATGHGGKASLPQRPVARRDIAQHHLQPLRTRLCCQRGGGQCIGKQHLHAAKAIFGRGGEALEHGVFGVEEGQIGSEVGHGAMLRLWRHFSAVGLAVSRCAMLRNR